MENANPIRLIDEMVQTDRNFQEDGSGGDVVYITLPFEDDRLAEAARRLASVMYRTFHPVKPRTFLVRLRRLEESS